MALADPRALLDPFITRVYEFGQIFIGDDIRRQIGPNGGHQHSHIRHLPSSSVRGWHWILQSHPAHPE